MINDHIAQRLERDVAVESLEQVAQWLLFNALDAGADEVRARRMLLINTALLNQPHHHKQITVRLHGANNALIVEDNGCGIPRADLPALCTPCSTSARTAHRSGRALARIASVARLCITSRPRGSFETVCKVVQQGVVVNQGVASAPRAHHGTTVEVTQLFDSVPVRARHHAAIGYGVGCKRNRVVCCLDYVHRAVILNVFVVGVYWPSHTNNMCVCVFTNNNRHDRQVANVQHVVLHAAVFHPHVAFTMKQHGVRGPHGGGQIAQQPVLHLAKVGVGVLIMLLLLFVFAVVVGGDDVVVW